MVMGDKYMLSIVMVRHGETNSNKKGTYLGWTDVDLNEKGLLQARIARDKLKDQKFDGVYSSPLMRTARTAQIINEYINANIVYSNKLKERNFGIWDNLTFEEITSNHCEEAQKWHSDWINYCIKDGESAIFTYNRVASFVNELLMEKKEGKFLVVSHLGSIRFLLAYLLGLKIEDSWRFRVDNCGICRVDIEDDFGVLTLLNG